MPQNARQTAQDDIRAMTAYTLANRAGVASPDSPTSPGADWLDTVRLTALEVFAEGDAERGDAIAEAADGVVPIYTHTRMVVLVDLAAYSEDVEDLASGAGAMTIEELAGLALYQVAERLIGLLVDLMAEADDDDVEA